MRETYGVKNFGSVIWKRAKEIYGKNYRVFGDKPPQPGDIRHGMLTNGYFLTVLSAMAGEPHKIYGLFETKQVNTAGIYMVYFFVNGVRTPVIVDDLLPVW